MTVPPPADHAYRVGIAHERRDAPAAPPGPVPDTPEAAAPAAPPLVTRMAVARAVWAGCRCPGGPATSTRPEPMPDDARNNRTTVLVTVAHADACPLLPEGVPLAYDAVELAAP